MDRWRRPRAQGRQQRAISYDKQKEGFDERDKKLCSFLWEHGYTSPYRQATFHWKAPLFVFRQAFKYQVERMAHLRGRG